MCVFIWKQYIILASYKDFWKLQRFCLCSPLQLYFSGIWICSEYDAVFNSSCIASCNQTKSFTFSFTSFLSQESDSESFKQSTCTFYPSEILLFKVFINACVSWEVKWQLIGAFSLVLDIQWIRCQYLQQIEIYLDHQYSASVSSKKLALHW